MPRIAGLHFGRCHLVGPHGPLFCDGKQIPIRPKSLTVLWHLAICAGQVLTKKELVVLVWQDRVVSEGALTVCIREIRQAIGDTAKESAYIKTVHGHGYCFVNHPEIERTSELISDGVPTVVGRLTEFNRLQHHLKVANNGQRQMVLVSGEAGIGKSALIADLHGKINSTESWQVGFGQCVENISVTEPYLPLLEALEQICHGPYADEAISALHQYAPSWVLQLPSVLDETQRETLLAKPRQSNRRRMQRELADALEAISAKRTLILILEDLHWSDPLTVQALGLLARRRKSARLLLLASYRPVELTISEHPLKAITQELKLHHQCDEIELDCLDESAVEEYMSNRLNEPLDTKLISQIHQRTEGHPLFLVELVDYLKRNKLTGIKNMSPLDIALPTALRQHLEYQIERLSSDEQQVLEAASVVGRTFTVTIVAAALEISEEAVQRSCENLSKLRQFILDDGIASWPDGTSSGAYVFCHAMYAEVLYDRLGSSRRVQLHRRIGQRLKLAYTNQTPSTVAVLAHHSEKAGEMK